MGAIEKKIIEGVLRLTEAHRMLNHLKRLNGFECIPLEDLVPRGEDNGNDKDEEKPTCSLSPEKDACQT